LRNLEELLEELLAIAVSLTSFSIFKPNLSVILPFVFPPLLACEASYQGKEAVPD